MIVQSRGVTADSEKPSGSCRTSCCPRVGTSIALFELEAAINDRPRPGQERKLDGRQEAHLIAFACSAAPEGHTHWTLQLLADKVVELEFAESISLETVRQLLKKTNSSRGRRRSGVSPR